MTATSRGIAGPEVSGAARRFGARLRLAARFMRIVRGTDSSDVLTIASLGFLFVGLAAPSWAFGVVGGLLVLVTPIGVALRLLVRGR